MLRIPNKQARRLWLSSQGLAKAPTGPLDVMSIIKKLGFVQLDTIQVISRAHHHIIWSRNNNYREPMLNRLLAKDRAIFEHFTHDASVIPMDFYQMWQRQFRRKKEQIDKAKWYSTMLDESGRNAIKDRIAREGALSTHAFDTKVEGPKEMWARPPHKLALDYMWYAGELATCHRVNFTKFYNLANRIFPNDPREAIYNDQDQIDWLCHAALHRMSFGTLGEVQKFWEATDTSEVKEWVKRAASSLVAVEVQGADGTWTSGYAPKDIEERLLELETPTSRLRILNPFDPVIRDRKRLERLFGIDYKVEMFVPAAKRKWGYYVYPILEGDRFVGRIEAKADRAKDVLNVINLWAEPNVKWTSRRQEKVQAELERLGRFIGVLNIDWLCSREEVCANPLGV